jgi:hypothetical protein
MAQSNVQHAQTQSAATVSSLSKAFGSNNAANNLLIYASVWDKNAPAPTSSDTRNTLQIDIGPLSDTAAASTARVDSALNCGSGANTVQFSWGAPNPTFAGLYIHEYTDSATHTNGFTKDQTAQLDSSGSNPASGNTPTTTKPNEIVFGFCVSNGTNPTAGTGFTLREQDTVLGGIGTEDQFVTSTGAQNATFVNTGATGWTAQCVTYFTAATSTPWASLGASLHPGRSPGKSPLSARFWQPPQAYSSVTTTTVALTGASATFSPGTLGATHTNALTGAAITSAAGSVGVTHTQAITGQRATFASGTLGVTHTEALVGQRATFTPGIVSSALSIPLAGSNASFGAGTVTPVTGIFVALTGASATFASGILSPQGGDVPSVSTPSVSTIGGITQWTLQIPRLPEKKRITFVRNMENRDREDLADIVSFLRRL